MSTIRSRQASSDRDVNRLPFCRGRGGQGGGQRGPREDASPPAAEAGGDLRKRPGQEETTPKESSQGQDVEQLWLHRGKVFPDSQAGAGSQATPHVVGIIAKCQQNVCMRAAGLYGDCNLRSPLGPGYINPGART